MCSDWAVSIRAACGAIGFDRSTFHYKSRRADQAAVEKRIKEICETRVRYGYRRVHVLLDREGWGINIKKVYRIYRELGMPTMSGRWILSMTSWRRARSFGF
jgi:putative transposase